MKIVSLDVHAETSLLALVDEQGELLLEMKVATDAEALRKIAGGIPGPKRVVFEEGPMSAMLHDALSDVCEEVVSCNPTHNALIARAEDSSDERDAQRLALLVRTGSVQPVYNPPEPYRTLRGLLGHDQQCQEEVTALKNRVRGMCRRHSCDGLRRKVYARDHREKALSRFDNAAVRWQVESVFRQLDLLVVERAGVTRQMKRLAADLPEVARITSIPGVGALTAWTLVAWVADPDRFLSRSKANSYAGLGIAQGVTNWRPTGRSRASRRGNRRVKRVLMIAAKAAARTETALGRRYAARLEAGWDRGKATRDLARKIFFIALSLWRNNSFYEDDRVSDLST
jgi:transposase